MTKDRDVRGIFITATGTDVGKTYISGLILKKLNQLGLNCGYYKPAMSGVSSEYQNDVQFVKNVANLPLEKSIASYSFADAVSPHLAARKHGVNITLDKIVADFLDFVNNIDYVVVEGAGGITCPFNLGEQQLLLSDVIKALKLDVILVADGGLGTLNSTLLTCEYAKAQGVNVKGIILNNFDANNFMHQDNLIQIERLTEVKVISTVQKDATELDIDLDVMKGLFD